MLMMKGFNLTIDRLFMYFMQYKCWQTAIEVSTEGIIDINKD